MELRHLKTFVAVADAGSFTRAAGQLGITQAGASQSVGRLEKQLDTRLFQRQRNQVTLTPAGQRLYFYAQRIVELIERAGAELGQASPAVSGTLRIAASTVPAEWLLPELLARFRDRYPEVCESVTVSDSRSAARAVLDHAADVGFVGERPGQMALRAVTVAHDELVLVVRHDHPFASRAHVPISALRAERFIMREAGSGTRGCVAQALAGHGLELDELNVAVEVNSNEAIRAAVTRGLGVAFLSRHMPAFRPVHEGLATVRVRGLNLRRRLYLITDKRRHPSPLVSEFISFVRKWHRDTASAAP